MRETMIHEGVQLHNISELLRGDGAVVIPSEHVPRLVARKVALEPFADTGSEGMWTSRIPDALRLTLNPLALVNAVQATGAELRFNLRSAQARIVLKCNAAPGLVEIYQGSFFVGWHVVRTDSTEIVIVPPANLETLIKLTEQHGLPFDARLTRVVLPWRPAVRLISVEGEFELPQPEQTPTRRYMAYGSSITHGSAAIRSTGMYAQRTAQLLNADLHNLGFGGGAHLEPQMADYIAGRSDWDFATLETGINLGSVGVTEFARLVDYFIPTIAHAHADKWIFCLGLFTCHSDLNGGTWAAEYREIVKSAVKRLNQPRVVYVDGRSLLPSVQGLTTDLVHPSPFGMEEIACNLSSIIRRTMGIAPREGGSSEPGHTALAT